MTTTKPSGGELCTAPNKTASTRPWKMTEKKKGKDEQSKTDTDMAGETERARPGASRQVQNENKQTDEIQMTAAFLLLCCVFVDGTQNCQREVYAKLGAADLGIILETRQSEANLHTVWRASISGTWVAGGGWWWRRAGGGGGGGGRE